MKNLNSITFQKRYINESIKILKKIVIKWRDVQCRPLGLDGTIQLTAQFGYCSVILHKKLIHKSE